MRTNNNLGLNSVYLFLVLTVVFALVYTQSPLFTSNQNQYFLHGIARAGYGTLNQDWLANTVEPTPVFSAFVEFNTRYLRWRELFYFYYAVLMGIYFLSILGITLGIYKIGSPPAAYLYIAILLTIHSTIIRYGISRVLGANWADILESGVANQHILGDVLQPSTFGVFLIFSIFLFTQGRSYSAVCAAVIAAIVHPTYLLSAASLVFAYMLILYRDNHRVNQPVYLGLFALLIVSPILYYVMHNFWFTPLETTTRAQDILVNFRIPHHARIDWWFDSSTIIKIIIIIAALILIRKERLFYVMVVPFIVAFILTLLTYLLDNHTLALLFPWRSSVFILPLSTALIVGYFIDKVTAKYSNATEKYALPIKIISFVWITVLVIAGILRMYIVFTQKITVDDQQVMEFVQQTHPKDEIYLIPKKMQDFRLVTGAPVFVDFKAIPYRDEDVLEWYHRIQLVDKFYKEGDCNTLLQCREIENITKIVIPSSDPVGSCPGLIPIYSDAHYGIFDLDIP